MTVTVEADGPGRVCQSVMASWLVTQPVELGSESHGIEGPETMIPFTTAAIAIVPAAVRIGWRCILTTTLVVAYGW